MEMGKFILSLFFVCWVAGVTVGNTVSITLLENHIHIKISLLERMLYSASMLVFLVSAITIAIILANKIIEKLKQS